MHMSYARSQNEWLVLYADQHSRVDTSVHGVKMALVQVQFLYAMTRSLIRKNLVIRGNIASKSADMRSSWKRRHRRGTEAISLSLSLFLCLSLCLSMSLTLSELLNATAPDRISRAKTSHCSMICTETFIF